MSNDKNELHFDVLKSLVNTGLKDPDLVPDRVSIISLSQESKDRILTDKRRALLKTLKENGDIKSITELAEKVGRRRDAVSRDLKFLANYGFIDLERNGKRKVPKVIKDMIVLTL